MRFALSDEQEQFASSLRALLDDAGTPSIIRSWGSGEHQQGLKLWGQLAELGVTALLVPQRWDGLEAGPVDLVVAFEELGHAAVPGPLVESIAAVPVLLSEIADEELASRWLPRISSGDVLATLAAPPHTPYALDADVAELRLHAEHGTVHTADVNDPLSSVDAARRLFGVEPGEAIMSDVRAGIARALDFGVLATAAQLLGAGRSLLVRTTDYAKQRRQFGREIGQFQGIKHLLADVATQLELARPLLYGAAVALSERSGEAARDVSAAKVAAADAAYLAARTALQVHGAVGYTAEHDVGLWLTKVRALVSAWGTQDHHRGRVADALSRR
jgi:alkylation response protein AidB-like acyl-CoA dehydrogenase